MSRTPVIRYLFARGDPHIIMACNLFQDLFQNEVAPGRSGNLRMHQKVNAKTHISVSMEFAQIVILHISVAANSVKSSRFRRINAISLGYIIIQFPL